MTKWEGAAIGLDISCFFFFTVTRPEKDWGRGYWIDAGKSVVMVTILAA